MTTTDTPAFAHRLISQENQFRAELLELWRHAGEPDADTMSRRSGRPAVLFGFLRASGLPSWDEVSALLTALGHARDADRWRRRWARLDGKRRRDAQPFEVMDGFKAAIRLSIGAAAEKHRTGPLNQVLGASTTAEYAEALTQLRLTAGLSYADIERISKRTLTHSTAHRMTQGVKLPRKREQVVAFVTACGGSLDEGATWWAQAQRIRRGEPAGWQNTAVPVSGLVDRDPATTASRSRSSQAPHEAAASSCALCGMDLGSGEQRQGVHVLDRQARLESENTALRKTNGELEIMLDSAVRAFRIVEAKLEVLEAELADAQTSQFLLYDRESGVTRPARWVPASEAG